MMHEPEKSDPSIVAPKPTNKSDGSDAESVERREGAEGNTSKERMRRTQGRGSMSSGLERVRERAKAEKKEQFTVYCTMSMWIYCGRLFRGSSGMRHRE
jgi:hypothetical protein